MIFTENKRILESLIIITLLKYGLLKEQERNTRLSDFVVFAKSINLIIIN